MPKVLLIDDEQELGGLVSALLEPLGLEVEQVYDGETGLAAACEFEYALILLDMRLPRLEGIEVCKGIRRVDSTVPIIMLSSVDDQFSKVLLMELGADDYITKPFDLMELKVRVKSVLRRVRGQNKSTQQEIVFENISINLEQRVAKRDGEEIDLTLKEFELLVILASNPGRPFSREELNQLTSGYESSAYDHSITSHINRIRRKLEADGKNPRFILTAHGIGYKFAILE